jgi:RNA polymerase-binding transcription factor DksA
MVDEQATRTRLTEMLAELDRSAEVLEHDDADLEPGELSNLDQHPADSATYLQDTDREQTMRDLVDVRRQEIQAALRRLDDGTYGRCVDCGRELSDERLDARPEAARCIDCQAKAEAAAR